MQLRLVSRNLPPRRVKLGADGRNLAGQAPVLKKQKQGKNNGCDENGEEAVYDDAFDTFYLFCKRGVFRAQSITNPMQDSGEEMPLPSDFVTQIII